MGDKTNIEWCDSTWNPTRGCSRVSPGCQNCYAERTAIRQVANGYAGLVRSTPDGPRWTGKVRLVEEQLDLPMRWRKPRRIFVDSMSDLFHEELTDEQIRIVLSIAASAHWHTFQILTKRAERMRRVLSETVWLHSRGMNVTCIGDGPPFFLPVQATTRASIDAAVAAGKMKALGPEPHPFDPLPKNLWFGVSVEDQQRADERIPLLLQTPAAVRFLSAEPLIGPIDWPATFHNSMLPDQIIVGGESGPNARPCETEWIRATVEFCKESGIACFVKQLGKSPQPQRIGYNSGKFVFGKRDEFPYTLETLRIDDPKGGDPAEWPPDLRVREFPAAPSLL